MLLLWLAGVNTLILFWSAVLMICLFCFVGFSGVGCFSSCYLCLRFCFDVCCGLLCFLLWCCLLWLIVFVLLLCGCVLFGLCSLFTFGFELFVWVCLFAAVDLLYLLCIC